MVAPKAKEPGAPEPRRPLSQGDLRAAMLHAADCLDASLDAQVDGDEAELLRNLETVLGIGAVVAGQMRGSASKYLRNTEAMQ